MKNTPLFYLLYLSINLSCSNTNGKDIDNKKTIDSIREHHYNDVLLDKKPTKFNIDNINNKESNSEIINDSLFQDEIDNSVSNSFKNKDAKYLDEAISKIKNDNKIEKEYKTYWISYILFHKSLFYKNIIKDDSNASKYIDESLNMLEDNLNTSEDYALYAYCLSFSIQFANMTQLSKISTEVINMANKSLELNSKNVRAYLVLTSNNFYTPKMFGGMNKVEEYAIKGLKLPSSTTNNFYDPYWGKPRLYEFLIDYYNLNNQKVDADRIKVDAKKEFSNYFNK